MKKIFLIAMLYCLTSSGMAQTECGNSYPLYIEVTGYAEQYVLPDIAYLSIVLDEKDPATASKGIKEMETIMKQTLKSMGIDITKQLSIDNISSQFAKRKKIDIRNTYTLELTDLSLLQDMFIKLDDNGISNIYIKRYKVSNIDSIKLSLKTLAVKDAKAKAIAISDGGTDRKVRRLIHAIDFDRGNSNREYMLMSAYKSVDEDINEALPDLNVKEVKVSASILTRWGTL